LTPPLRRWTRNRRCCLLALAATFAGAATVSPHASRPEAKTDTPAGEVYQIRRGDVLQLFVRNETDLIREATVRPDGRITMPMIGDVVAEGRAPDEIAEEIRGRLKEFVTLPVVTVSVGQAAGSVFYVVGQVARAGGFPLVGRTTVLHALALAGGFREFARPDRILVVREGKDGDQVVRVNYKRIEDGGDLTQNIALRPGDTVVVP
jgi:polysaccharide export outer membrane protein